MACRIGSQRGRNSAPAGVCSVRTGATVADLRASFLDHLFCSLGRVPHAATCNDLYTALALTVRDRLLEREVRTLETYSERDVRLVSYLSAEFLPGPHLANALLNLGIADQVRAALTDLGLDLDELIRQEEEPGLGNGGLGRLASCFLDSLATLEVPAIGYGIRYEFGIFDQTIRDGWQVEITDKWLRFGNPWELPRPEIAFDVCFGGHTEAWTDEQGRYRVNWLPDDIVKGVACDTPIGGYRVGTCSRMRLWKAEAVESFDVAAFNHGDYYRAVEDKMVSENISKILYPSDDALAGKRLRLQQQAFLVCCSLRDMIRVHRLLGRPLEQFHAKFAVQLNDTHPALAVAELMRLLVDEHLLDWDTAWNVTQSTFAYTNHTLLPEALETWPVAMLGELLPRHLEIIYEINRRFLDVVRLRYPGDETRVARLSLIDEAGERRLRMAHLATVGSHAVNGVARLHSHLLRSRVLKDFAELWPERFLSVTNGVTPRRFIALCNPDLARLINSRIGAGWLRDLEQLQRLEPLAEDPSFREEWRQVTHASKQRLATVIAERVGLVVDPLSMFDIQVKRIHEYKRQHLNILHILTLYLRLRAEPQADIPSRTFIFGGKAAPGYALAKLIIKLIHATAELVNRDPAVADRLRVVFIPDFNVTNAQPIYPAADLSEQLSTAGKEASGTGNMKFGLNGALTIGTLDGANVEILEAVGEENFFLFGLTAEQVEARQAAGYRPREQVERDPRLAAAIGLLTSGALSGGDRELFRPLVDRLLDRDPFLVLADYGSYVGCQEQVSALWRNREAWTRASVQTVARMGRFSSDRAIREYCQQIWHTQPVPVELP
jgi:starch phosphorylase